MDQHVQNSLFDENNPISFVNLKDFVEDAIYDFRYSTPYNFTGKVVPGYEKVRTIITSPAAVALKEARDSLKYVECVHLALGKNDAEKIVNISFDIAKEIKRCNLDENINQEDIFKILNSEIYTSTGKSLDFGNIESLYNIYTFKIFDTYRPYKAVNYFMNWAKSEEKSMKRTFYPLKSKEQIIKEGYLLKRTGHSRGSTVDLTLFNLINGKDVDMGSPFDYFGEISNYDQNGKNVNSEQQFNRTILRLLMIKNGFNTLDTEWWHFTLKDEPYPDIYFDF